MMKINKILKSETNDTAYHWKLWYIDKCCNIKSNKTYAKFHEEKKIIIKEIGHKND